MATITSATISSISVNPFDCFIVRSPSRRLLVPSRVRIPIRTAARLGRRRQDFAVLVAGIGLALTRLESRRAQWRFSDDERSGVELQLRISGARAPSRSE